MMSHFDDQKKMIALTWLMACVIVLFGFGFSGCISASQKQAANSASKANELAQDADQFIEKVNAEGMTSENQYTAIKKIQNYSFGLKECAGKIIEIQNEVESEKENYKSMYFKTLFTLIGLVILIVLFLIFRFRSTIISWAAKGILKV